MDWGGRMNSFDGCCFISFWSNSFTYLPMYTSTNFWVSRNVNPQWLTWHNSFEGFINQYMQKDSFWWLNTDTAFTLFFTIRKRFMVLWIFCWIKVFENLFRIKTLFGSLFGDTYKICSSFNSSHIALHVRLFCKQNSIITQSAAPTDKRTARFNENMGQLIFNRCTKVCIDTKLRLWWNEVRTRCQ